MAGLLDFLAGSSDPSTADPTTGLVEAQRRQLAYGILGQAGAALLQAGAPQMPGSGDMGRALGQLGNIPGNVANQQSQMVNQNLASQRGRALQDKIAQEKAAQAYIQSPEYQQQLEAMPPVLKAQALVNIKAGDYSAATKIVSDYVALKIQSAREEAKTKLEANKAVVTHDAAGNPIAYYPMSGKVVPIGGVQDPYAAYGLTPPGGTPVSGGGVPQTLPDGTPISDNPYPNASINPTLPYNQAFGVGGAAQYAHGRIQGTTGIGKISNDLNMQNAAVAQFDKMRTELVNEARSEAPGSSRIKAIYSAINDTLPVAGSAFHDAPYALKQLVAAKDSLVKELQNTTALFQASNTKPGEKQKLAQDIQSLRKNLDNVNIVVDKLTQNQGGTKPNKGTKLRFNPETGKIE